MACRCNDGGAIDVYLRGIFAVEHVVLAAVHPLSLPGWAQALLGGPEACRRAKRTRHDIAGCVCYYEVAGEWSLPDVGKLEQLARTGEVFVLLTRPRAGPLADTFFRTGGSPTHVLGRVLRFFIGGTAVGVALAFIEAAGWCPY